MSPVAPMLPTLIDEAERDLQIRFQESLQSDMHHHMIAVTLGGRIRESR